MGSKKKTTTLPVAGLHGDSKIGGRVRLAPTTYGTEGRIVWANGVSVKITWDDSEQVTWQRDSLADRRSRSWRATRTSPSPQSPSNRPNPPPRNRRPRPRSRPRSRSDRRPRPFQPTAAETPPAAAQSARSRPRWHFPASRADHSWLIDCPAAAEVHGRSPPSTRQANRAPAAGEAQRPPRPRQRRNRTERQGQEASAPWTPPPEFWRRQTRR